MAWMPIKWESPVCLDCNLYDYQLGMLKSSLKGVKGVRDLLRYHNTYAITSAIAIIVQQNIAGCWWTWEVGTWVTQCIA